LRLLKKNIKKQSCGLIIANVQETDLSGHRQDVKEYLRHLRLIDKAISQLLDQMKENDLLLITGDHGNDPTIGHPFHTREKTPIILLSKKIASRDFKERKNTC
jgi:phosphopentomutase